MSGIAFVVIDKGQAAVVVHGTQVATLGPGDYFGELAMISQRARIATRGADADALPQHPLLGFQGVRKRRIRR